MRGGDGVAVWVEDDNLEEAASGVSADHKHAVPSLAYEAEGKLSAARMSSSVTECRPCQRDLAGSSGGPAVNRSAIGDFN